MLTVENPSDFKNHVGEKLGESGWFTIEQKHISQFAALTGDDFWIHVDEEKARNEMPNGKTIAHGFFILSLIPLLQRQIFKVNQRGKGLNYGSNRVRFIEPVSVGSRVKLHQSLLSVDVGDHATKIITSNSFELEGLPRPCVIADFILLLYEL
jgi:hypothetical protein